MKKPKVPSFNLKVEREKMLKILRKRGYAHTENSNIGMIFERIGTDGFVDKLALTTNGNLLRYKPSKPIKFERQTLPVVKERYAYLDQKVA